MPCSLPLALVFRHGAGCRGGAGNPPFSRPPTQYRIVSFAGWRRRMVPLWTQRRLFSNRAKDVAQSFQNSVNPSWAWNGGVPFEGLVERAAQAPSCSEVLLTARSPGSPSPRRRQTRFALRPLVPGTLHRLGLGRLSGSAAVRFGRGVDRKSHWAGRHHGIGPFASTRSSCQPLHFSHPFLQHALRRIAMQPSILAIWDAGRC
jgi:hypothetical protein